MALSMLLAAALGAQAEPAPAAPPSRFIVCPGHPRCRAGVRGRVRVEEPRSRLDATRGFTLARPEAPAPPADPASAAGRIVYFGVNGAALDARARAVLGGIAQWLRANPRLPASIEGHADSRGSRQANLALARRRAEAVRDYLIAQGVAPGRLSTVSYGEERPALHDSGESVWMMNRRVEIRTP